MSKSQHSSKEAKKKPLLTAKEKRLVKHAKKHSNDATTLLHEATPLVTHCAHLCNCQHAFEGSLWRDLVSGRVMVSVFRA
jgi:hypothetical protein